MAKLLYFISSRILAVETLIVDGGSVGEQVEKLKCHPVGPSKARLHRVLATAAEFTRVLCIVL